MAWKTILLAAVLCVLLAFAFGAVVDNAHAQVKDTDKQLATKDTSTSLGTKEFDEDKLPGKLEIGLAIGSIIVMIAVFKWL